MALARLLLPLRLFLGVIMMALMIPTSMCARYVVDTISMEIQRLENHAGQPKEVSKFIKSEVSAMFGQIPLDFAPYTSTNITLTMVEQAYCSCRRPGFRLQVVDNKLYVAGETLPYQTRHAHIKKQLLELYRADGGLPDVDIYFGSSDFPEDCDPSAMPPQCRQRGPHFHHTKTKEHSWGILHPDETFGGWPESKISHWAEQQQVLKMSADAHPWPERGNALFFAGANLGYTRRNTSLFDFKAHPEVDIRWVDWARPNTLMPVHDFCKFKHLLHMAGCTWSSRLKWIMLCRAAIVFPESPYLEFWHRALRPGGNYILIPDIKTPEDGMHIVAAAQQLQSNDSFAQGLAAAAQATALYTLSPANVQEYWRRLLHTYSSLQTFKPQVHPDAVPLHTSIVYPRYWSPDKRTCKICPHSSRKPPPTYCRGADD